MAAIWCWSVLALLVCSVVENIVLALACFEMTPRNDIFILAGADLQINCTLNMSSTLPVCDHIKSNFNIHEVSIVKGSSDVPASLLVYNEAERTLTMNRPNVTVQDEGIYRCMYGNNRTVIHALKKVHVAESPSAPENLTCISKNTYDLRCYFTPSKKPVNIIMNWTMEYRLSVSDHSKVICSETSTLVYMCICPEDKQFYPERYQILIEGVNETFGIYVNKSFQVRLDATIVQPNPVQDLRIAMYNISDTITLLWSGPDGLVTGSETIFALDYKIVIMSDWDHRTEWINDTRDPDNTYNVSSLIAFSNYSITVQAKPTAAVGNIYWSDSRKVIFSTHSKISQHAVSVMPGSYILAECGSLVCPVLYWKNPDRKYWNGLITGYRIVIKLAQPETSTMDTRDGIEKRNIVFHPEKRNIVYHIEKRNIANEPEYEHVEEIIGYTVSGVLTTKLLKDISYRVQMKLMNTEGVSGNYSEIIVPDWNTAQKFKPNWVSVQTAVGEPGSLISWNMNPTYCEDIVSVTYYWCVTDTEGPSNTSYFICKKNFDWVTVNITKQCGNETTQYITQLKNQSDVKYAVSLHTRDISGEMLWENLRFSVRKVPEKPLYQVSTEGTTLKIRIQYRGYHVSEFGKPEQYSVVYKECVESSDCKPGTVKKFPANFSNPVYNINNLKLGSKYQVYMKSENSYGSSVPGDPEMISITEVSAGSSSSGVVYGAVFGSLAALIVIVAIVVLIRRRLKSYELEMKITLPGQYETIGLDLDGTYAELEETGVTKLNDHDSGKGSDSPGSSAGQLNKQQEKNVIQSDENTEHFCGGDGNSSSTLIGYHKAGSGGPNNLADKTENLDDESDFVIEEESVEGTQDEVKGNAEFLHVVDEVSQEHTAGVPAEYGEEEVPPEKNVHSNETMQSQKDFEIHCSVLSKQDTANPLSFFDPPTVNENINTVRDDSTNVRGLDDIDGNDIDKDDPENMEESSATLIDNANIKIVGNYTRVIDSSSASFGTENEVTLNSNSNLELNNYKHADNVSLSGSTFSESSVEESFDSEKLDTMTSVNSGNNEVSFGNTSTKTEGIEENYSDETDNCGGKDHVGDESNDGKGSLSKYSVGHDSGEKPNISDDRIEKSNASVHDISSSVENKNTSGTVSLQSYMKTGLETNTDGSLEYGNIGDGVKRDQLKKELCARNAGSEVDGNVKKSDKVNSNDTRSVVHTHKSPQTIEMKNRDVFV